MEFTCSARKTRAESLYGKSMNQEAICKLKNNDVSDAVVMVLMPIVSVCMLTYNHAQYIEQAI